VALSGTGVANADLRISASATPNPVKSGGLLTYTVLVVNDGPQAASTVRIVDTLPTASQFRSLAAPAGWTCTGPAVGQTGTVICQNGSMAAGATATLTITVKVVAKAKATVTNTASVTAATNDPDPADNTVTVATSVHGGNP
jgi:uncharacterized repeat protein (TIGR01451 family)